MQKKDRIIPTQYQLEDKYLNQKSNFIIDNRNTTILQRKLKGSIEGQKYGSEHLPVGSARFQEIASLMGSQYGVDTSSLVAKHNSSFPATLNAEATIQGRNIHFAPGKDTDYNIRQEVAHAIDNTLNGTPNGDFRMNGHLIDASRESKVDQMASNLFHRPNLSRDIPHRSYDANSKTLHMSQPKKNVVHQLSLGSGRVSEIENLEKRNLKDVIKRQIEVIKNRIAPLDKIKSKRVRKKRAKQNSLYKERIEVLKSPSAADVDREGYFVFRTSRFETLENCKKIVSQGQVLKRQEGKDLDVEEVIESNKAEWQKLLKDEQLDLLKFHLTDSSDFFTELRKRTLFKSTSVDENVLFGVGNLLNSKRKMKEKRTYTLLKIIEITDEDLVYDAQAEAKRNDFKIFGEEREISLVGGIKADSIVWAAAIEE